MKLAEYLDKDKLRKHVETGLVTERFHNNFPLAIYCYSRKTVTKQLWDDVTIKTRGLIVDTETDEIVSRPYEKFFAYDTIGVPETHPYVVSQIEKNFGPPLVTEKVNGCLGIFWKYGIHWGVASKGSFHSPHAEWATKWLEDHVEHNGKLVFPEGYTPVFEIICQEVQPHTIKYEKDALVLLDFVSIETGEELERGETIHYATSNALNFAASWGFSKPLNEALEDDFSEFEGYVLSYPIPGQKPFKLKIKFPTFLKNRKKFYEELKKKEEPKNETEYKQIFEHAGELVKEALVKFTTRKEVADFFNLPENRFYAPACFSLMDSDKPNHHKEIIWKLVEQRQYETIHTR